MQQAAVTPHPTAAPRARRTRTHGVFPAFAAVLMLCVVAGFGRTFFFRAWFEAPPLSSAQAAHGVVVTGWFAVFLVQALLVRHDRVALHRRLGLLGVAIAVATLVTATLAVLGTVDAFRARGDDVEALRGFVSMVVWGNLGALAAYATFVVRGIVLRRRADVHARMMLLASIAIVSPALIRIATSPAFAGLDGMLLTLLGLLAMLGALLVHDVVVRRRPHRETVWGAPFFLVTHLGAAFLLPGTALDSWLLARIW